MAEFYSLWSILTAVFPPPAFFIGVLVSLCRGQKPGGGVFFMFFPQLFCLNEVCRFWKNIHRGCIPAGGGPPGGR